MEGKAGLVTGAASGIGRACALRFARRGRGGGRRRPGVARAEGGAGRPSRRSSEAGGQAEFFACDVSRSEDNAALVARVVERFGRLDFAHNNAGIGVHRSCTRPPTRTSTA